MVVLRAITGTAVSVRQAATKVQTGQIPQPDPEPIARPLPEDAAAVGLIMVPALVNKLHHKDVTTYPPQVAEADGIGILQPVPAARIPVQQVQQAQQAQLADLVLQAITGWTTAGVCLTQQETAEALLPADLPQAAGHPAVPALPDLIG